jgi:hypothetical protein
MDAHTHAGGSLFCRRLKGLYEPLAYAGFREFDSAALAFDLFSEHHGGRGRWNSPTRMAPRAATRAVACLVYEHRRCLEDGIRKNGRHPRAATLAVARFASEHHGCLEDGIHRNERHPERQPSWLPVASPDFAAAGEDGIHRNGRHPERQPSRLPVASPDSAAAGEDGIHRHGWHPRGVPMLSSPAPPAHRPGAFCSVCGHRLRTGCRCVAG